MSTNKHLEIFCCLLLAFALLLTVVFCNGKALGLAAASSSPAYEQGLFDYSKVHSIDIVMDDWDSFIETCENEEYVAATVVIDGIACGNVGIRAKGNTSLSNVSSMDSDRYSFKIEFDQYEDGKNFQGLDKLVLNNMIQDNTYMKDFLTYQMMSQFGTAAPLCSYAYITVNGEDWGLYLAVEAIEDSFLQRNYGSNFGDLYKPDSLSMGGGRGNGQDFDMENFDFESFSKDGKTTESATTTAPNPAEETETSQKAAPQMPDTTDFDPKQMFGGGNKGGGGMGGGMGSSDVKLQYIDDDPDSYSNIFSSAKTTVTDTDQTRLISSLKTLSSYENLESVLNMDSVLRYFVVHNFVVNGDSYTGSMIHNYYLYEEDGLLSMIPWDYNLAFGSFQGNNAKDAVNDPIDSPLSISDDRPMAYWIFTSEEYTQQYHQYFEEFMTHFFSDGQLVHLIDSTAELIAPYVEKDPSKFCTYEEFETGVETLRSFIELRGESVSGQLDGSIPSTAEGQAADSSTLIDVGSLSLSGTGSMGMGGGRGNLEGGFDGDRDSHRQQFTTSVEGNTKAASSETASTEPSAQPTDREGTAQTPSLSPEGMMPVEGFVPQRPTNTNDATSKTPSAPQNNAETGSANSDSMIALSPENGNTHSQRSNTVRSDSIQTSSSNSSETLLLLGVSAAVLIIGLAVAKIYKRRR